MEKIDIEINTVYDEIDGVDTYTTIVSVNGEAITWSTSSISDSILIDVLDHIGYNATVKRLINGE